jgi:hypothetical protein
MRPDMAKVVTEAPRYGHANKSKKFGGRFSRNEVDAINTLLWRGQFSSVPDPEADMYGLPEEDTLVDEDFGKAGMIGWSSGRNENSKSFSDVLGPLRGYLRKQVGRPWDDVWSELSANLDKRSITGQHIFSHIKWEVQTNCWLGVSGTIYEAPRYGNSRPVEGLYVHPHTGILCNAKKLRRYRANTKLVEFQRRLETFETPSGVSLRPFIVNVVDYRSPRYRRNESEVNLLRFRIQDDYTLWEHREDLGKRPRSKTSNWFIHRFRDVPSRVVFDSHPTADNPDRQVRRIIPAHKAKISTKQASKKEIQAAIKLLEVVPF